MADAICKNLVYLSERMTNITAILVYLQQENIITQDEKDNILLVYQTPFSRNSELLYLLGRKDWDIVLNPFLEILKLTGNRRCADVVEGKISVQHSDIQILEDKWWPERKIHVNSFFERRLDGHLLIEEIYHSLMKTSNGKTVINQKITVSGLGGIGKTTVAKWFAIYYQESYDYIIWIDCGEGNLVRSFKDLANDLRVQCNAEDNVKRLSQKCFTLLRDYNCLVIFDNAECYIGNEGIRDVLPKHDTLYCIITSRSTEWGHESGYGKITCFQLDVFNTQDSVEFLKKNLIAPPNDYSVLTELCEILGNLPIALQIAVATLNNRNMSVPAYIQRLNVTDQIINTNFDDYEKTINSMMKVSIDLLKSQPSQQTLIDMVTIFGYIQPDDVDLAFFQASLPNEHLFQLEEATHLLEKYSLISAKRITVKTVSKQAVEKVFLSMHRLLQQVIRHNGREIEEKIISSILTVEDRQYMHYKIMPFKYAEKYPELRSRFAYVKGQLLDHGSLKSLLKEMRFAEALHLSEMFLATYNNGTRALISKYNQGICLEKSGHFQKSYDVFSDLYSELYLEEIYIPNHRAVQLNILNINSGQPNPLAVGLWLLHLQNLLGLPTDDPIIKKAIMDLGKAHSLKISGDFLPISLEVFPSIKILETDSIRLMTGKKFAAKFDNKEPAFDTLFFLTTTFLECSNGKWTEAEKFHFHELGLSMRELSLVWSARWFSKVHVNLSLLPLHCLEKLSLIETELSCTENELPAEIPLLTHFSETTHRDIVVDLNNFLSRCLNLVSLELSIKFPLNISRLSRQIKNIKLFNLEVVRDKCDVRLLQLEKLVLNHYPVNSLAKVANMFQSDFLIIGINSESEINCSNEIIHLIDKSKKTVIGNFTGRKCLHELDLKRYRINGESSSAFIITNGNGREITMLDFLKHSRFE